MIGHDWTGDSVIGAGLHGEQNRTGMRWWKQSTKSGEIVIPAFLVISYGNWRARN